jgi:hypothetical protein
MRTGAGIPEDDGTERLAGSIPRAKAWAASRTRLRLKQLSLESVAADRDGLEKPEPNPDRAVAGEALEGLPRSKSVARAAEAARNQGDPEGSYRTNYESQTGKGVQRQEERPEARQGVGFVHSSPRQDAGPEAGEGTNRLTKPAQATNCRKNDGSQLANLPAGDTPRVSLKSPVRENRTPGSVRGGTGQPVSLPRP